MQSWFVFIKALLPSETGGELELEKGAEEDTGGGIIKSQILSKFIDVKKIVCLISSVPPCKNGYVRSLNPLSDQ